MKKYLLFFTSAALLLVGCAKEQIVDLQEGELTNVTFTANLDNGVATKAYADNDGAGTNVNRCIMEIYFQNQLYKRMEAAMSGTPATATFANVPVVAGKEYQVLFWADCGGAEKADLYYKTTSLKAVTVAKTAFTGALEAGDNDKLDAFCFGGNYTVPQNQAQPFAVTLKRPFAQLNVITTDVAAGKTVINADLLPEKVSVSYTAATTFNVADSTVTGSAIYAYEAPVYGDKTNWETVKTRGELTLSMDYILASTEQGNVDVTFVTKNGGQAVMTHNLTNLPYKRNYRTNVKGELLTAGGTWKAEIDPDWGSNGDGGEINHIIASSYTDVKTALQSGDKSDNLKVTVTPAAVNNLSDEEKAQVIVDETIDGSSVKALKFVLYEEKKDGEEIIQQASPEHVEFELPKRPTGVDAWKIEYEPAYPTETVVVSTKEENNANVIIEAPKSTVTLEAAKINSVVSTTSENTLIIPQGLELKNLTVKKGAVEYHGTGLEKVTIATEGQNNAYFKTSEGLANTDAVYGVVKDHVAEGYAITKESESTWKIVPEVCKIGTTSYGSLKDAVAAVPTNGSETTITMVNDFATTEEVTIAATQNIVLDLNGKKVSYTTSGTGSFIKNTGKLKVKDSGTNGIITAEFSAPNWSAGCYTIDNFGASPASKLVIESGTIENTSPAGLAWPINNGSWGTSADLVINGGTIHSTNYVPVREYLQYGGKKTIVINGGKLISDKSRAIAIQLNDATVADQGSYVEINGGEFSCNGSGILYVDLHAANLDMTGFTMTVNGGKFKNANEEAPVLVYDTEGNDQTSAVLLSGILKGGVYSKKPAVEIVTDKYIVAENSDATYPWKVVISPDAVTVANIGTTEYYSLSDALTAAKEGEAVYIIPAQLEETVSASNDNNIQLILNGKAIVGDIAFGGKGTLIVRAEELNKDYYSYPKAYEVDAPTIPAQGVGGIMGKISATDDATVMLRENLYSGPFEGNVELRGGFYYSGLGLDNIKAQTPSGIGLVVEETQKVQLSSQEFDMYYVPEVPESYLVHFPNVAELMTAYIGDQLSDEQINQITFGYGLGERIMQPWWLSVDGGDNSLVPTGDNYFPDDVYAFFTNLRDGEYDNPKYAYQDWLCDYVISYSEPIKKDYQSGIWGYYSNMSIGCWLPSSVTQAPFAMLSAVNMKRSYSQMLSDVGMFLCGPVNLNPEDTGIVITVNLNIYPDSETNTCITTNKVVYTIPAISE